MQAKQTSDVTAHPHAAWAAQEMVEAVGFDAMLSRVIRDRDGIYGKVFDARIKRLGLEQFRIAPRSHWQNGYAERFVGTLRRELLDHMIVLGERATTTRTALTKSDYAALE